MVYTYYYVGSQLARMTYGDYVLDFFYDINGTPIAMRNGSASTGNYTDYYYITNLQGDIIRVVDRYGNTAAYYEYDPYGNAITASGSHANINPLRYRGYVYDSDSGLYYLQSRYYDPKIGQFLTHDVVFDLDAGLQGFNLFAYCGNNPICRIDVSGTDSDAFDGEAEDTSQKEAMMLGPGGNGKGVPNPSGGSSFRTGICSGRITGYTRHGLHQATTRDGVGVKPTAIIETVRNPSKIVFQDAGKIKYIGKQAVVVVNESGKLITTYAKSSKYSRVN